MDSEHSLTSWKSCSGNTSARIRNASAKMQSGSLSNCTRSALWIIDADESVSAHCRDHSSLSVALRLLFQSAGTDSGKLRIENRRLAARFRGSDADGRVARPPD